MFDGGTVPANTLVQLQAKEVSDYGFFPLSQAHSLLHELTAQRLSHALHTRQESGTVLVHTPGYLG